MTESDIFLILSNDQVGFSVKIKSKDYPWDTNCLVNGSLTLRVKTKCEKIMIKIMAMDGTRIIDLITFNKNSNIIENVETKNYLFTFEHFDCFDIINIDFRFSIKKLNQENDSYKLFCANVSYIDTYGNQYNLEKISPHDVLSSNVNFVLSESKIEISIRRTFSLTEFAIILNSKINEAFSHVMKLESIHAQCKIVDLIGLLKNLHSYETLESPSIIKNLKMIQHYLIMTDRKNAEIYVRLIFNILGKKYQTF